MRTIKKYILLLFLLFAFIKVDALSLDKNEISVVKGQEDNINLSVNVDEEITSVEFSLIFSTYDIPAKFVVASEHTASIGGISNKINFSSPVTGNVNLGSINVSVVANSTQSVGYINLTGAKATTVSGSVINLNPGTINVNVLNEAIAEEPTTEKTTTKVVENKKTVLESIESNIVDIKVKENVKDYTVVVPNNVNELDLKPILSDNSYKVDISSQKLSELKDNKITITLTKNYDKQVYTIKVIQNKVDETQEEVSEFKYKGKFWLFAGVFVVILCFGVYLNKKKD